MIRTMETCEICKIEFEGGTYIDSEPRRYFCSGKCLEEWGQI